MDGFRTAYVYVWENFAEVLSEVDAGYSLTYDATYLSMQKPSPVSLTLPFQAESYLSKTIFPFLMD